MSPGTIYMYYSRGKDSFNFSAKGKGNAVLIKSAFANLDQINSKETLRKMQKRNPINGRPRDLNKLCSGQTLLCKSLGLKVPHWNAKDLNPKTLYLEDSGHKPDQIIKTKRLGIPKGRDEHLLLRFIDKEFAEFCTKKPSLNS